MCSRVCIYIQSMQFQYQSPNFIPNNNKYHDQSFQFQLKWVHCDNVCSPIHNYAFVTPINTHCSIFINKTNIMNLDSTKLSNLKHYINYFLLWYREWLFSLLGVHDHDKYLNMIFSTTKYTSIMLNGMNLPKIQGL